MYNSQLCSVTSLESKFLSQLVRRMKQESQCSPSWVSLTGDFWVDSVGLWSDPLRSRGGCTYPCHKFTGDWPEIFGGSVIHIIVGTPKGTHRTCPKVRELRWQGWEPKGAKRENGGGGGGHRGNRKQPRRWMSDEGSLIPSGIPGLWELISLDA